MSNPCFIDGRLKIGKSDRDPTSFRKKELYTTGVPEPFEVEYIAFVEDYNNAERKIHRKLSKVRNRKDREFFNIPTPEAIHTIRELCTIKLEEVLYKSPQEIEQIEKAKKYEEEKRIAAHIKSIQESLKRQQELQKLMQESKNRKIELEKRGIELKKKREDIEKMERVKKAKKKR